MDYSRRGWLALWCSRATRERSCRHHRQYPAGYRACLLRYGRLGVAVPSTRMGRSYGMLRGRAPRVFRRTSHQHRNNSLRSPSPLPVRCGGFSLQPALGKLPDFHETATYERHGDAMALGIDGDICRSTARTNDWTASAAGEEIKAGGTLSRDKDVAS